MSRRPHEPAQALFAISSCVPTWTSAIIQGYDQDSEARQLLSKLTVEPSTVPHFSLQDGIIRYKSRIWLGSNNKLQVQIMSALHDAPSGGHSGFPVTYRRIKQLFAWKAMKSYIKEFVASCSICQQPKPDRVKYPGLLQPLPVPSSAWQIISMDFIEALPKSQGKSCVLVVVDKFTKYKFTAASVAKVFFDNIYKLHGLPDYCLRPRQDFHQLLLARIIQIGQGFSAYEHQLSPLDRRSDRAGEPMPRDISPLLCQLMSF